MRTFAILAVGYALGMLTALVMVSLEVGK